MENENFNVQEKGAGSFPGEGRDKIEVSLTASGKITATVRVGSCLYLTKEEDQKATIDAVTHVWMEIKRRFPSLEIVKVEGDVT